MSEAVRFTRDTEVIRIPEGNPVVVPEGSEGVVMQDLGGAWTLRLSASGLLVRVGSEQADAIGKQPTEEPAPAEAGTDGPLEERVWAQLRTCFDPEIPVNIVDLGLIYDLRVRDDGDATRVDVKMTLTAPGCGMGTVIAADARDKIRQLEGVDDAEVEVVWDPPWNPRMISPEGRAKLGLE